MAFMNLFVIIGLVSSTALASVTRNRSYHCRPNDYRCKDDSCISFDKICDGITDCFDGDDETICDGESISFWKNEDPVLNRLKRQTTANCRKNQWQCRDGSCITFDGKCDGVVDCVDGSDETHALCRKTQCQSNWFRCTYGACVDGTAPCNGVQECADNSDELLPRCRNETEEIRGQFKCQDGRFILAANRCDGAVDCTDGSDETVRACAGMTCPSYLFQCAYGACVDQGADCNQITDCADGSDESAELCDKMAPVTPVNKTKPTGPCILPAYPEHGSYSVTNAPTAVPGQGFNTLELNVTCNPGYGTIGSSIVYCISGKWSAQQLPQCIRFCKLNSHPSVRYTCILSGNNDGFRPCKTYEPHGTQVHPMCNTPNYYTPTNFNYMNCIDGNWDYIATCLPGLPKNGTNVTILIRDKIEIYISGYQYTVRNKTESNITADRNKTNKVVIENTTENRIDNNTVDYDAVDVNDWRIAGANRPVTEKGGDLLMKNGTVARGNATTINVSVTNSTVSLSSKGWLQDIIVFRD